MSDKSTLSCDELEFQFEDIYGDMGIPTDKDEEDPLGFGLGGGDAFNDSEGEGVLLRECRGRGKS